MGLPYARIWRPRRHVRSRPADRLVRAIKRPWVAPWRAPALPPLPSSWLTASASVRLPLLRRPLPVPTLYRLVRIGFELGLQERVRLSANLFEDRSEFAERRNEFAELFFDDRLEIIQCLEYSVDVRDLRLIEIFRSRVERLSQSSSVSSPAATAAWNASPFS